MACVSVFRRFGCLGGRVGRSSPRGKGISRVLVSGIPNFHILCFSHCSKVSPLLPSIGHNSVYCAVPQATSMSAELAARHPRLQSASRTLRPQISSTMTTQLCQKHRSCPLLSSSLFHIACSTGVVIPELNDERRGLQVTIGQPSTAVQESARRQEAVGTPIAKMSLPRGRSTSTGRRLARVPLDIDWIREDPVSQACWKVDSHGLVLKSFPNHACT